MLCFISKCASRMATVLLLCLLAPVLCTNSSDGFEGEFFDTASSEGVEMMPVSVRLSLPQSERQPKRLTRAATLTRLQKRFVNGPRFHSIDGFEVPFSVWRGPQSSVPVMEMSQAEMVDIGARGVPKLQAAVGGTLQEGVASGAIPMSNLWEIAAMYYRLEHLIEFPLGAIDWDSDRSFAHDRLTIRGFALQAVTKPPPKHFKLSDELVTAVTGETTSVSVKDLIEQQRLFEIDLMVVGNFPKRRDPTDTSPHYVPGAHALFFVSQLESGDHHLMPLAIYIADNKLTYTPLDAPQQWRLAKIAFACAESNYIQGEHLVASHLVHEPIRVELIRHVSKKHPVYSLLDHHFKNVFGITQLGLRVLFSNGTVTDRVFGWRAEGFLEYAAYREGNFHWSESANLKLRFKKRGLTNLTNYWFRDDALAHYKIILSFVKSYLRGYYKTNDDLALDYELQSFLQAIASKDGAALRGFPKQIRTFNRLSQVLSDIIVSTTVVHHAMNSFALWHMMSFPMGTPSLWAPLPSTKEDEDILLRPFLPPTENIIEASVLYASFYRNVSVSETIGHSYRPHIIGTKDSTIKAIFKMQHQLRKLKSKIEKRAADVTIENSSPRIKKTKPYTILLPSRVPYFSWI